MTPEQTAAAAIARSLRAYSLPTITEDSIGRHAVEAISAASLLIVPAARLSRLLAVERAARALLGSEALMMAEKAGDEAAAELLDPWPEADDLVAALIEVSP